MTKPFRSKFIKEKYLISYRFVKVFRIVEYGPVPAKAVREKIHKGNTHGFLIGLRKSPEQWEYGPVPAKAVWEQSNKTKMLHLS